MSKISFLIYFICLSSFASLSEGIQLIAKGEMLKGTRVLENLFEEGSISDQAKASLILSRIKNVKMENAPHYYAKYALRFLTKHLIVDEIVILNSELGHYQLSLGNLDISKKYYLSALDKAKDQNQIDFLNNRLAWVSFNNSNYKVSLSYLEKMLNTNNQDLRDDSLYLLGKTSVLAEVNLSRFKDSKILNSKKFIAGVNEAIDFIAPKNIKGNFSRFYFSVHGKVKDICLENFSSLPGNVEIEAKLINTYLKKCLIQSKSKASEIKKFITKSKLEKELLPSLALSYFVNNENAKACELYKKGYSKDLSLYNAMISTCAIDQLDINLVASIERSCNDNISFQGLEAADIDSIFKIDQINNKSLVYHLLKSHLNNPNFDIYLSKLGDCSLLGHLKASKAIIDESYFSKVSYTDVKKNNCSEYTTELLEFIHLKFLYGETLSSEDKDCLRKNTIYQNHLLSFVDFNQVKDRVCAFDFDCELLQMSGYMQNNSKITSRNKVRKYFYYRINQLIGLRDKVKKISMNSLEGLYKKVTSVKRVFKNPKVNNVKFMHKVVDDYNSIVDSFMASLDNLKGLDLSQKNLLKNALKAEKVVL